MAKFNKGKPYCGSYKVNKGKLKGTTDGSHYFYFICPECDDNQIMRVLEYEVSEHKEENEYNEFFKKKATEGFTLAFHIHCEKCGLDDFTKISNIGLQQGNITQQQ